MRDAYCVGSVGSGTVGEFGGDVEGPGEAAGTDPFVETAVENLHWDK